MCRLHVNDAQMLRKLSENFRYVTNSGKFVVLRSVFSTCNNPEWVSQRNVSA